MTLEELNDRLRVIAQEHWLHDFSVSEKRAIIPAERLKYRIAVLKAVLESLLPGKSLFIINENSGIYPALALACGASTVAVNNPSRKNCEFIRSLIDFFDIPVQVFTQNAFSFRGKRIYVDMKRYNDCDFVFCQGVVWNYYKTAGYNFQDVIEAAAFYAREGVLFNWDDAKWAIPQPPENYHIKAFCRPKGERFEHVVNIAGIFVLALNPLPNVENT